MEKWNNLAQKFFRMHKEDLRPTFYAKWAGKSGRFQREIQKLEQNFRRKCSNKNTLPRRAIFDPEVLSPEEDFEASGDDFKDVDGDGVADDVTEKRKRRSGKLRVAHNPGHRMRHIVRNVGKWTREYLGVCSNQKAVVARWEKFIKRWEEEIAKNPVFQKEFEDEEKYLRKTRNQPGRPCGRIYREFGLHGQYMELQDASIDENYGFGDLGRTDFGNDHLMSMVPYEGCYIRAYQHYNKEGYSSICDNTAGCSIAVNWAQGVLTENEASSVYCYCDAPSKFFL